MRINKEKKRFFDAKENVAPNGQTNQRERLTANWLMKPSQQGQSTRTATHRPEPDLNITEEMEQPQDKKPQEKSNFQRSYSQNRSIKNKKKIVKAIASTANSLLEKRSRLEQHVQKMLTDQKIKEQQFISHGLKGFVFDDPIARNNVFVSQFQRFSNLSKQLRSSSNNGERQATLSKYIAQKSLTTDDKDEELVAQQLTQCINFLDQIFQPRTERQVWSTSRSSIPESSGRHTLCLVRKLKQRLEEALRLKMLPGWWRQALNNEQ